MNIEVSIRKRLSRDFCLDVAFSAVSSADMGILGASGSGKSLTLKCIAGIETPDEGHISLNGRVLFDSSRKINLKPQVRNVGYLFQNYALFPRMTVLENILLVLPEKGPGGNGERKRRALVWLGRFGLEGLEDRYPAQLSGGQQQRAALARMLSREPELILLDEPFSALDSHLRDQMQLQLQALLESWGAQMDMILVTHNRDEVYRLCDDLLLIDGGRVIGKGKTRALFENPGSVQAARLTGCKNISPVRRLGDRDVLAVDWGLLLRAAAPLGEGISHVGIRAHDFVPVGEAAAYDVLHVAVCRHVEEPFEHILIFTNADVVGSGELWWKYSRYLYDRIPPYLRVASFSTLQLQLQLR
jgi:molybdate transport system ATP-binding protein